ncbi:restriction endonuclease subunit S [Streptosporangium saharense]|uniref:restriction endonuclease subunit S n=1 Tax=Streptosporangium saharense TaxID=1706840 RepID=UPI00344781FF
MQEKLWWAECIKANRYRYNFGRQANRSLASLELPDAVPEWVHQVEIPEFFDGQPVTPVELDVVNWAPFRLDQLFELVRGRHVLKRLMEPGRTPYVSASAINNGISAMIDVPPDHQGGLITISSNGSVGEAFYQPDPFIASGDVTVLRPKLPLSEAASLFVCTLLYAEKFRWNYGRKWSIGRLKDSVVRLPVSSDGQPDWDEAERFVKSLPLARVVFKESL